MLNNDLSNLSLEECQALQKQLTALQDSKLYSIYVETVKENLRLAKSIVGSIPKGIEELVQREQCQGTKTTLEEMETFFEKLLVIVEERIESLT